jgi:Na+-driven multidrug efflux pump
MFSLSGETLENAKAYFSLRQIGNFFSIVSSCFSAALTARGKVSVVVIVGLATSVLSVTSIFLFVNTPLGSFMPMIYNCAWSNIVLSFLALIAYVLFYCGFKYKIGRKINFKYVKRLFRIGIPGSIGSISYQLSTLFSTMIISMLDVTLINVKIYCDSIFAFVHYFGWALAQAGGVMGGRLIGMGDYDKVKRLYRQNFLIVLLANGILAVVAFIFREQLYMIFDRNPSHLALILPVFLIDIIVELGRGTNHTNQIMLNAAGDVVFSTVVSVISCWVCGVFLCYVFAIALGWGLVGCWIAFAFDEWLRGILCTIRWKSGRWQLKTV